MKLHSHVEEGDSEVLRQSGTVEKVVRHAWNDAQESPERKHDRLQTRNLTAGAFSHSLYSNTLQCTTQNYISEDIWLYAGSWGILLEGLILKGSTSFLDILMWKEIKKKLPQQMQKENGKLALLHTQFIFNYLQNCLIFWP